jgi:DNA-binding transcriptional regulator YhcF (GntR family)
MKAQKTSEALVRAQIALNRVEIELRPGSSLPSQDHLEEHLANATAIAKRAMKKLVRSGKSGRHGITYSIPAYRALRQIVDAAEALAELAGHVHKRKAEKKQKM